MAIASAVFNTRLLSDVVYLIGEDIGDSIFRPLTTLLEKAGARPVQTLVKPEGRTRFADVDSTQLTHFITFAEIVHDGVHVVTPFWVTRSCDYQVRLEPAYFSTDRRKPLSGCCLTTTDLPNRDTEHVADMVAALGGQYAKALTKTCTHLLALKPEGKKYEQAIEHGKNLGMKVVLPSWLTAVFTTQMLQNTKPYQWPNPPLLRTEVGRAIPAPSSSQIEEDEPDVKSFTATILNETNRLAELDSYQAIGSRLSNDVDEADRITRSVLKHYSTTAEAAQFFKGRRIYLATSLDLNAHTIDSITTRAKEAGAIEVFCPPPVQPQDKDQNSVDRQIFKGEWDKKLEESDYIVVPRRQGWEYWKARQLEKTIGNYGWLLQCFAASRLLSPLEHLLLYPAPPQPIPTFKDATVTMTNYTGSARDLLKRMLELMGFKVDGSMDRKTKYVIAASKFGKKAESAVGWNIPVISHHWVFECYSYWEALEAVNMPGATFFTIGTDSISYFPPKALSLECMNAWAERAEVISAMEKCLAGFEHSRKAANNPVQRTLVREDSSDANGESEIEIVNGDYEGDIDMPNRRQTDASLEPGSDVPATASTGHVEAQLVPTSSPRKTPKAKANGHAPARPDSDSDLPDIEMPATIKQRAKQKAAAPRRARSSSSSIRSGPEMPAPEGIRARRKAANAASELVSAAAEDMNLHERERKRKRPSDLPEVIEHEARRSSSPANLRSSKSSKNGKKPSRLREEQSSETDENDKEPVLSEDEDEIEIRRPIGGSPNKFQRIVSREKPTSNAKSISSTPKAAPKAAPFLQRIPDDTEQVNILATMCDLEESQKRAMSRLGATMVEKPSECTHLVAPSILKTEKWCCAMAYAHHVVKVDWIMECINQKALLDPSAFYFKDADSQLKHGFRLSEAINRARDGPVFDGKVFYITPNNGKDVNVLRRVVQANGGQAPASLPVFKNIVAEPGKYFLVSSQKDSSIWAGAQRINDFPVYKPEFITTSACAQRIDLRTKDKVRS